MKTDTLKTRLLAAALCFAATATQAATINFSSLETVLADPDDTTSKMSALWTGWATQLYEYNMPFIELANDTDATLAIEQFTMTIGNSDYHFSNEFLRKEDTNSYPYPADGSYAIAGFSTPDIEFTSTVADDGDTLIVNFTDGLQPGEVVRFQVDINGDSDDMMLFADYTSVFFRPSGDDTSGNSTLRIDYADSDQFAETTLPNLPVSGGVAQYLQSPRPYQQMQMIDVYPDTTFDPIPEPTAVVLASLAVAAVAAGRRV